jgi:hypothetical protein
LRRAGRCSGSRSQKPAAPVTPTVVHTTTTLSDLEKELEAAKEKKTQPASKFRRPRKITEEEVKHATPSGKPGEAMPVYTEEELAALAKEEAENPDNVNPDEPIMPKRMSTTATTISITTTTIRSKDHGEKRISDAISSPRRVIPARLSSALSFLRQVVVYDPSGHQPGRGFYLLKEPPRGRTRGKKPLLAHYGGAPEARDSTRPEASLMNPKVYGFLGLLNRGGKLLIGSALLDHMEQSQADPLSGGRLRQYPKSGPR